MRLVEFRRGSGKILVASLSASGKLVVALQLWLKVDLLAAFMSSSEYPGPTQMWTWFPPEEDPDWPDGTFGHAGLDEPWELELSPTVLFDGPWELELGPPTLVEPPDDGDAEDRPFFR